VGQPDTQKRSIQIQSNVETEHRNESHLQRHHQQANNDGKEEITTRESHPGKGIGRKSRDGDRNDRGRNGHDQTIQESVAHAIGQNDILVIFQCPLGKIKRCRKNRPPTRRADRSRVTEAANQ